MKDIIEANLKAKAIEKMNAPKNPEIVLFIESCAAVRGKGELKNEIVIFEDLTWLIIVYVAIAGKIKVEVGVLVFTTELKEYFVPPPATTEGLKKRPPLKYFVFYDFRKFASKVISVVSAVSFFKERIELSYFDVSLASILLRLVESAAAMPKETGDESFFQNVISYFCYG